MTRFLHTADWHMGLRSILGDSDPEKIREIRYETAKSVVSTAHQKEVDFVLVVGDLFDHRDLPESCFERTLDILERLDPIPVYILPGDHDPLEPGGVWSNDLFDSLADHIRVLTTEEPRHVKEAVLFPCPLRSRYGMEDPTSWIPPADAEAEGVRIGVAHGSLEALESVKEFMKFPIPNERVNLSALDYLALGDWHSYYERGRAVYPGTFEPTDYREEDAGQVVVVEIGGRQSDLKTDRVETAHLDWHQLKMRCMRDADVGILEGAISEGQVSGDDVVRVDIQVGEGLSDQSFSELDRIRNQLKEEVFYLDWNQ